MVFVFLSFTTGVSAQALTAAANFSHIAASDALPPLEAQQPSKAAISAAHGLLRSLSNLRTRSRGSDGNRYILLVIRTRSPSTTNLMTTSDR